MLEYSPKDHPRTHCLCTSPRTLKLSCRISTYENCQYRRHQNRRAAALCWHQLRLKKRKLKKSPYTRKGWLHLCAPTKHAKQMLLFDCIAINLQGFWGMPLPIFTPWLIGIAENYNACLGDNCNCLQFSKLRSVSLQIFRCWFRGQSLLGNWFYSSPQKKGTLCWGNDSK